MIEPMHNAQFEMRWNGVNWDIRIERFVLKDIQGIPQLGQEFSQLVLKAFEDNYAKHLERNAGPLRFNHNAFVANLQHEPIFVVGVPEKAPNKFKGNK